MARGYVVGKNGRWYIQIFDDTGKGTMRSVAKELGKKDVTEKDAQKLLRGRACGTKARRDYAAG